MSTYRVHIETEFVVEIDETNREVDGPAALQGDTCLSAVRRALYSLYGSDLARHDVKTFQESHSRRRKLGVKNILVRGKEQDIRVETVPTSVELPL